MRIKQSSYQKKWHKFLAYLATLKSVELSNVYKFNLFKRTQPIIFEIDTMPVLTDGLISKLAGTFQSSIVIRDSRLSALKVRFSKRKTVFIFDQQMGGNRQRFIIGQYPSICTDEARLIAFEHLTGKQLFTKAPAEPKQESTEREITYGEILTLYLQHKQLRQATVDGYQYFLDKYGFANKPFSSVTAETFLSWYKSYAEGAPTQAKKVAALIKSLSRWYCQYVDVPVVDVTAKVKTLLGVAIHSSNVKERKLTLQELPSFFNAVAQLRQIEQDAIMLVLFTAIRKGELFALTDANFTVKDGLPLMVLDQTKNGRRHELPLAPAAAAIVQRRINTVGKGNRLFQMTDNSRIFNKLFELSNIRVSWHDLRRSWASFAVNDGVSELMIKRCLNHVEQGVTGRHYAHLSVESVYQTMRQVESLILENVKHQGESDEQQKR